MLDVEKIHAAMIRREKLELKHLKKTLKLLRKKPAKKVETDDLFMAMKTGDEKLISMFLDYVRDINMHQKEFGDNLLFYASSRKIAELLVEKGIDIHHTCSSGHNALFNMARYGYADPIEYLCDLGVDINQQSKNGETPLHYTEHYWWDDRSSHESLVRTMLSKEANLNICDKYGRTYLHEYFEKISKEAKGYNPEFLKLLYESGGDFFIRAGGVSPYYLIKTILERLDTTDEIFLLLKKDWQNLKISKADLIVRSCKYIPDLSKAILITTDMTLVDFQLDGTCDLHIINRFSGPYIQVEIPKNANFYFLYIVEKGCIEVRDKNTHKMINEFYLKQGDSDNDSGYTEINSMACNADGSVLAVELDQHIIQILSHKKSELIALCEMPIDGFVLDMAFSMDSQYLIWSGSGSGGGFDLEVSRLVFTKNDKDCEIEDIASYWNEAYLLTNGPLKTVYYFPQLLNENAVYIFQHAIILGEGWNYTNERMRLLVKYDYIKNTVIENKRLPNWSLRSEFGKMERYHSVVIHEESNRIIYGLDDGRICIEEMCSEKQIIRETTSGKRYPSVFLDKDQFLWGIPSVGLPEKLFSLKDIRI